MTVAAPYLEVSAKAPVNIAVIKYWGKRDTSLILPTNSSLSVTLDINDLHTLTTVRASAEFSQDRFWLNGKELNLEDNKRIYTCIKRLRARRKVLEEEGKVDGKISGWGLHVASMNNFPTAAGLASSASGLACLVYSLARLYEMVNDRSPASAFEEISKYARMGSGSACRSIFGGYVRWEMGELDDGSDSFASQVAPKSYWPEMKAKILVVNDAQKDVSSTTGMQLTVETSELFQSRINEIVPNRMKAMENAILSRDFEAFAELTMKDSNQFHAVCMDTYPPIYYMNDISRAIVNFCHCFNSWMKRTVVAYTFDAGPNAVLYHQESDSDLVSAAIEKLLSGSTKCSSLDSFNVVQLPSGSVKRVISTGVGSGPLVASMQDSLLSPEGLPN